MLSGFPLTYKGSESVKVLPNLYHQAFMTLFALLFFHKIVYNNQIILDILPYESL
jgi:hypothetical protein